MLVAVKVKLVLDTIGIVVVEVVVVRVDADVIAMLELVAEEEPAELDFSELVVVLAGIGELNAILMDDELVAAFVKDVLVMLIVVLMLVLLGVV